MLDLILLDSLTKEQILEEYANLSTQEEEIVAAKVVLREEIMNRLDGDGEVIGNYAVSKGRRYSFTASLEQARELGAVKEAIDSTVLKKLHLKGATLPFEVKITVYPIIKNITQEKGEVNA